MSEVSKFRSALNGFSRTDVVNYLEEISAAHRRALQKADEEKNTLRETCDRLMAENARLKAQTLDADEALKTLREEDASLQAQVESLSQEAAQLAQELDDARQAQELTALELSEAREQLAAAEQALSLAREQAKPAAKEAPDEKDAAAQEQAAAMELAAYRRAAQTEQNAAARARKLREQLDSLCEESKSRYQGVGEEVAALRDDLDTGLSRLQQALADLQAIFDDTQDAFDELALPDED